MDLTQEHKINREKLIISLLTIMMLFFVLFTISLVGLKYGNPVFNLGIGYFIENWMIIILSTFFIVKIIYEMVKIQ